MTFKCNFWCCENPARFPDVGSTGYTCQEHRLRCVRSNCKKIATHLTRSEYFGAGWCDKHWNEADQETLGNMLRT